jgi:hypothetical protein
MTHQDDIEIGGLEIHALHGAQRGRTGLHQDSAIGAFDDISGLEAAIVRA